MVKPVPNRPAQNHLSRWIRFGVRILTIRGITWFMLAASLFATVLVCQQTWQRQVEARELDFKTKAELFGSEVEDRLCHYAHVALGVAALFKASAAVDAREFQVYVAALDVNHNFKGILALGYVEMVEPAELERLVQEARTEHRGLTPPFSITPPGERPLHMIVRYVEPRDTNRAALGYDAASEPLRRQAALAACDSGSAVITARLNLVQAPDKPGLVLFQPVYRAGATPKHPAERRASIQGWTYAAFLLEDMMDGGDPINSNQLDYELFDGNELGPDTLLIRNTNHDMRPSADRRTLEKYAVINRFGRPWTLRVRSTENRAAGSGFISVGLLATGGSCMSFLIFGIAHSMASTSHRASRLAKGMTGELRANERALRASEERLSMIIEGSNDGVWDWDMTTDLVYLSPRWKSMLGYEDHEVKNTFRAWQRLIHPEDLERARTLVRSYTRGERPSYQLEYRLRHKDGSYHWILARGVVSRDRQGNPIRMAGSHVDLTELKQAEQELRRTNEDLHRSKQKLQSTLDDLQDSHQELERTQLELIQAAKLESIGTLAAGVAHEVKNPLQIIVMGLDYVGPRIDASDEVSRTTLGDMRDAAQRADTITCELLEFSRATVFKPVIRDLEAVVARSLHLMKTDLTKSKVKVLQQFDGQLPPIRVDPNKIQQVLINLIHNALQAMEHAGSLTITTECGLLKDLLPASGRTNSPLQPDDEVVTLKLRDTGPGIPEEHLPRIFDPFFTTKPVGSGTGLGLAIVRIIIDLHEGLIHIRNAEEGGVEAVLAFKACRHAPDPPLPETSPPPE